MLIEWKDNYCIGVARIDEQHRQLIGMLNELYRTIGTDIKPGSVWPLLEGFNRYADTHFSYEERLAKEHATSPTGLAAHIGEHEAYRERMARFREDLEKGDQNTSVQLMAFISNWWLVHILVIDIALGKQLNQRGVY
jgi:hemerythrin